MGPPGLPSIRMFPPRPSRCRRSRARRCSSRSAPRVLPPSPSRSSTRSNVTWIDRPGPSGVQSMACLVDNRLSAAPRTITCNRPSRMRAPGGLRESSITPAPAGLSSPGAVALQSASSLRARGVEIVLEVDEALRAIARGVAALDEDVVDDEAPPERGEEGEPAVGQVVRLQHQRFPVDGPVDQVFEAELAPADVGDADPVVVPRLVALLADRAQGLLSPCRDSRGGRTCGPPGCRR